MCNALGIITYNDSSVYVEGMQKYRPIAGFSFLGRYRLVDFAISNMSNSGIDDIQIYVNGNPRSLIDHVGTGRHYNINSKHGHLSLVPVYTDGGTSRFTTDISCYAENIHAVMENHNDYVVIAPANMLYKGNYEELLKQHIESGAEVSVLYQHVDNAKENYIGCDVLQMNKQRGVLSIEQNLGNYKSRYLSLQTYIMSKEIFKTYFPGRAATEKTPLLLVTFPTAIVLSGKESNCTVACAIGLLSSPSTTVPLTVTRLLPWAQERVVPVHTSSNKSINFFIFLFS